MKDIDNDSGFKWGPFNLRGAEPWPLKITQKGGAVIYPYSTDLPEKQSQHCSDIDHGLPVIHKGNHFAKFTHPRDYSRDCDWFWWDNCLLPQIMDLTADKQWTRIVYRGCFPDEIRATTAAVDQRVQEIEQRIGQRLEDCIPQLPQRWEGSRVLYLQPNQNPCWYFYGRTQAEILATIREQCRIQGLELVVRPKLSRPQRLRDPLTRVLQQSWRAVITLHSAATAEIISAGLPCVQLGQGAYPRETVTWSQFCRGDLWVATPEQRRLQTRRLCVTVWHKQELLEGRWRPELVRQTQPQQQWRIYD